MKPTEPAKLVHPTISYTDAVKLLVKGETVVVAFDQRTFKVKIDSDEESADVYEEIYRIRNAATFSLYCPEELEKLKDQYSQKIQNLHNFALLFALIAMAGNFALPPTGSENYAPVVLFTIVMFLCSIFGLSGSLLMMERLEKHKYEIVRKKLAR